MIKTKWITNGKYFLSYQKIFRTPYGYHLIKVVEREIPAPPTLDEARDKIIAFLKQSKSSKLLEEWVGALRQGAEIVIHDN